MLAAWNFELYMLPLTLIVLFLSNLMVQEIKGKDRENVVKFVSIKAASKLRSEYWNFLPLFALFLVYWSCLTNACGLFRDVLLLVG